ncbi:serine/threonine-protein phosphatase 2A activator-like isoform X2 [Dreissena polymorpha]|uniref:serine/threonine-protein phosphatase 2A activator-like isoform X2 n=1 Tax=Dreissena polymorpha TaxID=45954 RepID=UPI002264050E|nr:serine/threonine-protein phosphatase 2A activator-like isoform X2 [Dreissena polymorpha]
MGKLRDFIKEYTWTKPLAYKDLTGFIQAMNEAVKGKKVGANRSLSPMIVGLLKLLETLDSYIAECPPVDQPQRFGNKAFRSWFDKMKQNSQDLISNLLDENFKKASEEIAVYLSDSFGNQTRIDYGTGHELAFLAFMLCFYKLGLLEESDAEALILTVFTRYLVLVRRLQLSYRMEPAGSQGVWALDDHQFLPFIWGSAQLVGHPRIQPKSFIKPEIYEHFAKDYMFLSCIKYINEVKTGPFAEHSNQLWNISAVPNWEKVNAGLVKMYKAEVLAKFPVIQHFWFGSLLSIRPAT